MSDTAKKQVRKLKIIEDDPNLSAFESDLNERVRHFKQRKKELLAPGQTLTEFASGHLYYGFHKVKGGWVYREWAPGATAMHLIGEFNNWDRTSHPMKAVGDGNWEIMIPGVRTLRHRSKVKVAVTSARGTEDRIPLYATYVVQDEKTHNFSAAIWSPRKEFEWTDGKFRPKKNVPPLIYEAHVGMATEEERVGTYLEFMRDILPRIKKDGYNTVQLMAVAEHPYYGSFGYHVSSLFAPSSRFGTPEELKGLIRRAHELGLAVIMDLVHSHYVRNLNEGINELDGTDHLYSPAGPAGDQPHWDSKLFDYGKPQVEHFLLSNIKYWLEEYRFDGFRFDGVTSMLYHHHGYVAFDSRDRYFDEGVNEGAITYLSLANRLAHDLRPSCVTIAEDVSGMPGICFPQEEGGVGFDYRLGMAIPDYWIKQIEEVPDEQWDIREMWSVMTDRLPGVKTVAYAESHDQALVGDKTIAFRLMDKEMYTHMDRASENLTIDRGMALHKMIRLMTVSTGGDAYLNFMGNEFGHPEWIDFPREGNGWSYAHARRQWSLAEDGLLRYSWLGAFDRAMLALVKRYGILRDGYPYCLQMDDRNQTIAFSHGRLVFVFNWHPAASIPDYRCRVREAGRYELILSTDERRFGGTERARIGSEHFSSPADNGDGTTSPAISIYNTSRTAAVYLLQ